MAPFTIFLLYTGTVGSGSGVIVVTTMVVDGNDNVGSGNGGVIMVVTVVMIMKMVKKKKRRNDLHFFRKERQQTVGVVFVFLCGRRGYHVSTGVSTKETSSKCGSREGGGCT
jgi:hypothetical protein